VLCFGSNSHGQLGVGDVPCVLPASPERLSLDVASSSRLSANRGRTFDLSSLLSTNASARQRRLDNSSEGSDAREDADDDSEGVGSAEPSSRAMRRRTTRDKKKRMVIVAKKLRRARLAVCGDNSTMVLLGMC